MGTLAKKKIGKPQNEATKSDKIVIYSYGAHDLIISDKYPEILFQKIWAQGITKNEVSGKEELRRVPVLVISDTYDPSSGEVLSGPHGYHYSITTSYTSNPSLGAMLDSAVKEQALEFADDNFEPPNDDNSLIKIPNLIVGSDGAGGTGWKAPR